MWASIRIPRIIKAGDDCFPMEVRWMEDGRENSIGDVVKEVLVPSSERDISSMEILSQHIFHFRGSCPIGKVPPY